MKGKGENERYIHLNVEFQRIARRDKNVCLSDQCKETEENNRMGKTRDLFKKIRDTKRTLHAKMGTIKDRNSKNLTDAEEVSRIHRKKQYRKGPIDPDKNDGIVTHLEPGILKCDCQVGLRKH